MIDQECVQILLGWCLGRSAAVDVVEAITARYFVRAGIEVSMAENISVNMGFGLYLEEERRRSLVGSQQCKVAEISNTKRLQTDLREEAYKSKVTVFELGCNTCGK